jgi:hypothetical protein
MILLQKSRLWVPGFLLGAAALLLIPQVKSATWPFGSTNPYSLPIAARSDGSEPFPVLARTDQVQFDNFSLLLQGQRVFL